MYIVHGTKPGPKQYLNQAEEKLSEYVVTVGKISFGKSRKQIKSIAEKVAVEKEVLRKDKISNGWLASFMKRHPELSL